MRRTSVLVALVIALGFAALTAAAQSQQDNQPVDREFLIKAITCNHAEIKASELVDSRTNNVKVKDFAQKLIKEHKGLSEQLADLAKDHKLAILAGTEKSTKDMLDRLSSVANDGFDREYLKTVIEEHEMAIQMCEAQVKRGTDAKLNTFAANSLPHLRSHVTEAKQLQSELKGK